MKNVVCMAAIFFFANTVFSFSQEKKEIDNNLENISCQYAECAAYYRLVYHALISSNDEKTANAYRELEDTAMFYSLLLANEGRTQEVAVQVTNSRIEMNIKKMKQEVHNRNENISILIDKYHFECQKSLENPSNIVLEILKTKYEETVKKP